ncbi:MAG: DUF4384 domain-containing protein [Gammaproteobacteria bacterium]|nr:DUF4384 domain-containing protein [Gammaproteobacteria bacterium]
MIRRLRLALIGALLTVLVGCQAVAPALTSLFMAFSEDLLSATAVNYTPRYAVEVENLLAALARHATGLDYHGQLGQAGYRPPPPRYARQQGGGFGQPGGYPPAYGHGGYQDPYQHGGGFGQPGRYPPAYGHSGYEDPYQHGTDDQYYGEPQSGYGQAVYQDPYAVQQSPYGGAIPGYQDPYAMTPGSGLTRSIRDAAPISLGVAILAQRAGSDRLEIVNDGDVLRDGRGDPRRGDLLRFHFQANCACWVYVIGIDATGFVARIFPDPEEAHSNPVQAGVNYLMPGGNAWWALDDYRGIEQIYFVASREQRPDIEAAVEHLAAQPRQLASPTYQPVREPAIVPVTRGLVRVEAPAPVAVPMGASSPAVVTPTIFTNSDHSTDVVITRWFRHE